MPFDDTGFQPNEPRKHPAPPSDNVISFLIVAIVFALLAMPLSLPMLVDIVRYLRGH